MVFFWFSYALPPFSYGKPEGNERFLLMNVHGSLDRELSRADVVTFSSCAMALERRSKWYLGVRSFVASTSKGGLTNKNWMNIYIYIYIYWLVVSNIFAFSLIYGIQ